MTSDDLGKSGFTRTVGTHDGMDFSRWNFQIETFEDGSSADGGVQVFDGKAHVFEKVFSIRSGPSG